MMLIEKFRIDGKTALVTGGSQGIGKSISLGLAENGADIIIIYNSNRLLAEQTKEEIIRLGRKCQLIECDLGNFDSINKIIKKVEDYGSYPDILVLNASIQVRKEWDRITKEEFDNQMNVNFKATLFLIQKFRPYMQQNNWGRILTIGSVQQLRPHPQMLVYAASKVAQMSMVKNLAPQVGPYNITINNLSPGVFPTIRNEEVLANEEYKKIILKNIPLGKLGETDDCASLALLLCSDAGNYITGQDIYVDGGMGLNY